MQDTVRQNAGKNSLQNWIKLFRKKMKKYSHGIEIRPGVAHSTGIMNLTDKSLSTK